MANAGRYVLLSVLVLLMSVVFIMTGPAEARAVEERVPAFGPPGGSATGQRLAAALADDLAKAMDIPKKLIVSADLGTSDPAGAHVFTSAMSGFPTQGGSFGALSNGNAADASLPNNEEDLSTELGGLNTSEGNDLVQLILTLKVPSGATHWTVDWQFLSEEFPENQFSDTFLMETSSSTFTIFENAVTAPNNVVYDAARQPVTNSTGGALGMTEEHALETTYDGGTRRLRTTVPIPPGLNKITIIFSVMDLGKDLFDVPDSIYDSTLFLDNFRFCGRGAQCESPFTEQIGASPTVTPAQAIQDLITTINGMALPSPVDKSLTARLNQAKAILDDNKPGNDDDSCGRLTSFLKEVDSSAKKKELTKAQAAQLQAAGNAIMASLSCQDSDGD